MKIEFTLKAVIEKDGKLLILKRSSLDKHWPNIWEHPGGGIHFGEEPLKGLKREVKEECGLNVEIIKPVRIWMFFTNSGKTQVFGGAVLCRYKSGKIRLSHEHDDFKWITPKELNKFVKHKGIKKDFEAAINALNI